MVKQHIAEARALLEGTKSAPRSSNADDWSGAEVAREILTTKVDGVAVKHHVREAIRAVVQLSQETHRKVQAARKVVEAPGYSGTAVDLKILEQLVRAEVREIWGDDPGAEMFAAMFAQGKFIY